MKPPFFSFYCDWYLWALPVAIEAGYRTWFAVRVGPLRFTFDFQGI